MTIRFILNGEDVEATAEADTRLVNILRAKFNITCAKQGCLKGSCGACSVMINGALSASCLIRAFQVQDSEIITLEGFSQTVEYMDINGGFAKAKVESCGFCDAGKIFAADFLLTHNFHPTKEEFIEAFRGVRCRCTDTESLYQGVLAAGEIRQRRVYGRY